MLFNSPDKWWGDHGLRDYPHEAIDMCLYRDRVKKITCKNRKFNRLNLHYIYRIPYKIAKRENSLRKVCLYSRLDIS
jgi:hypothetical protein